MDGVGCGSSMCNSEVCEGVEGVLSSSVDVDGGLSVDVSGASSGWEVEPRGDE